ncbi:MAG: hypothetical protein SFY66_22980 [Oculatellaceae cyanobacterium bins.114]|nr:hypothetical protein [Oculatellaceae cyanobacterium bins.114]
MTQTRYKDKLASLLLGATLITGALLPLIATTPLYAAAIALKGESPHTTLSKTGEPKAVRTPPCRRQETSRLGPCETTTPSPTPRSPAPRPS